MRAPKRRCTLCGDNGTSIESELSSPISCPILARWCWQTTCISRLIPYLFLICTIHVFLFHFRMIVEIMSELISSARSTGSPFLTRIRHSHNTAQCNAFFYFIAHSINFAFELSVWVRIYVKCCSFLFVLCCTRLFFFLIYHMTKQTTSTAVFGLYWRGSPERSIYTVGHRGKREREEGKWDGKCGTTTIRFTFYGLFALSLACALSLSRWNFILPF